MTAVELTKRQATVTASKPAAQPRLILAKSNARRAWGLAAAVVLLGVLALVSVAVGSKQIPLSTVIDALIHFDGSLNDHIVIRDLRLPRTVLGIAVGSALGLAGAMMQALIRNPLADPGLLGVNNGAAAVVAVGISVFGLSSVTGLVWFAFAGAAVASVVVYLLGTAGRGGATPVRLALAGTAVSASLAGFTHAILLLDPDAYDKFRFWMVGSLAGAEPRVLREVGPFLVIGVVLALALARPLNAIALGDDTAVALGAKIGRTRILGVLAITMLCGAATAAIGPVGFLGLTVPHIARTITGPDQRWVLPYSLVLAPILFLVSDVVGRVVARPSEIQVGIVTAFIGAPVFIYLVRRWKVRQL